MSAPILSDQGRGTFAAMWRSGRTCAAIGLALDLSVRQVKAMRPALGLKPRNRGGVVRIAVPLPAATVAALTARARVLQMPRQRFLALVLEREARTHGSPGNA